LKKKKNIIIIIQIQIFNNLLAEITCFAIMAECTIFHTLIACSTLGCWILDIDFLKKKKLKILPNAYCTTKIFFDEFVYMNDLVQRCSHLLYHNIGPSDKSYSLELVIHLVYACRFLSLLLHRKRRYICIRIYHKQTNLQHPCNICNNLPFHQSRRHCSSNL
jgi:hypothetical protein